ncbi:MAG: glutathione S-transferase family protein, partial [Kribbellaceae bacterium]|nr:glutathione S-transferase family protein [Kribbellaceae bacterium]
MTRAQFVQETSSTGEWKRQGNRFTGRISRESTSAPGEGPDDQGRWPVEAGRYRLVVSLACPWAHRSIIVRRLLGLEDAISLAVVDPVRDERGWRFTLDPDDRDPVLGIKFLSEAYLRTDPSYDGR